MIPINNRPKCGKDCKHYCVGKDLPTTVPKGYARTSARIGKYDHYCTAVKSGRRKLGGAATWAYSTPTWCPIMRQSCHICKREFHPSDLYEVTVEGVGDNPITQEACGDCLKDNPMEKILKSAVSELAANKEDNQ